VKNFEIDSRVGISGTQTCWTFPCVYEESSEKFFIWLGDVTIEKFTKTTFLNLVNFGQNLGATMMVLLMNREHTQKGIQTPPITYQCLLTLSFLDQFQKLFKVLDAHRLSKRSMQELMGDEHLDENVEKYAVYRMSLK
jgi:hypothetical protein